MTNLKPEAIEFLTTLPRVIRTCEAKYPIALALVDLGLMVLRFRTVLGNGQVRYCAMATPDRVEVI